MTLRPELLTQVMNCIADIKLTCDFTVDQMRYIAKLIGQDVAQLTAIVRTDAFANYGPVESEQIHADIRIGAGILGSMPKLPRETVVQP